MSVLHIGTLRLTGYIHESIALGDMGSGDLWEMGRSGVLGPQHQRCEDLEYRVGLAQQW